MLISFIVNKNVFLPQNENIHFIEKNIFTYIRGSSDKQNLELSFLKDF